MAVDLKARKILLCAVNTKYIHSNPAVYLLKGYAEEHCAAALPDIGIAEFTINNHKEDVLAAVYEQEPSAVFFSCYIWNREYIMDLAADLHQILPDTDLWLGGPEVSFDPEQILRRYPFLTGILIGEGEATFLELVQEYYASGSRQLQDIPGICRRAEDRIERTAARELLSMDELPFIYDGLPQESFEHRILYYESSRGCPFGCSYCLSSVDKAVRFRSLKKVLPELQFFLDAQVPQVKLVDRTFNIDPERTAAILRYLQKHDNGITNFHFEIAGDLLTEEELQIMEQLRPGLIQLEIGVQSTNPDTLRSIRRKTDLNRLRKTVERIREWHNIHVHLDLIAGLPYEDYASFARSFDAVYAMGPTQLQLGFLKVLKGSPMEEDAEKYRILYTGRAPYEVLCTGWITYAQIVRLKKIEEMVELYYNSRQFTGTIKALEQEFSSPFVMFEELARFYREKGYFVRTPSRLYRYQVLLDFIVSLVPDKEALYRELLTYDLYLRENLKSRPAFAPDLSPYREVLRELKADKEQHAEVFQYPVHLYAAGKAAGQKDGPWILLFDYRHKDPLDHNAAVRAL